MKIWHLNFVWLLVITVLLFVNGRSVEDSQLEERMLLLEDSLECYIGSLENLELLSEMSILNDSLRYGEFLKFRARYGYDQNVYGEFVNDVDDWRELINDFTRDVDANLMSQRDFNINVNKAVFDATF